jgi:hypothetical protein
MSTDVDDYDLLSDQNLYFVILILISGPVDSQYMTHIYGRILLSIKCNKFTFVRVFPERMDNIPANYIMFRTKKQWLSTYKIQYIMIQYV